MIKFVTGLRCAKDFHGESSTKKTRQPLCLNRNHLRQVRTSLYETQWSLQGPLKHSTAFQTSNHRWGRTAGHKTNMVQGSVSAQTFNECIKFVHKMRKSTHKPSCSSSLCLPKYRKHANAHSTAFWDVICHIDRHPHFTESCCFHLQGRRWHKLNYNMNRDNSLSPKKTLIYTLRKWIKTSAKGKKSLGFSNLTPTKAH